MVQSVPCFRPLLHDRQLMPSKPTALAEYHYAVHKLRMSFQRTEDKALAYCRSLGGQGDEDPNADG